MKVSTISCVVFGFGQGCISLFKMFRDARRHKVIVFMINRHIEFSGLCHYSSEVVDVTLLFLPPFSCKSNFAVAIHIGVSIALCELVEVLAQILKELCSCLVCAYYWMLQCFDERLGQICELHVSTCCY